MNLRYTLATPSQPPQILQIYRERLQPGREAAYDAIEQESARLAAALGCPHPYLGVESLTGPKEVWWLNGYESAADQQQVYDAYAQNTALVTALQQNSVRKAILTLEPIEVFVSYRQDASAGPPWILGEGRFLVIMVTKSHCAVGGTVFEAADGTRYIVSPAQTRADADRRIAVAGSESTIFAVRPPWSFPAEEWIAADPLFWKPSSPAGRD